jgi:hypothetical protein
LCRRWWAMAVLEQGLGQRKRQLFSAPAAGGRRQSACPPPRARRGPLRSREMRPACRRWRPAVVAVWPLTEVSAGGRDPRRRPERAAGRAAACRRRAAHGVVGCGGRPAAHAQPQAVGRGGVLAVHAGGDGFLNEGVGTAQRRDRRREGRPRAGQTRQRAGSGMERGAGHGAPQQGKR